MRAGEKTNRMLDIYKRKTGLGHESQAPSPICIFGDIPLARRDSPKYGDIPLTTGDFPIRKRCVPLLLKRCVPIPIKKTVAIVYRIIV